MLRTIRRCAPITGLFALVAALGCADAPTVTAPRSPNLDAIKFWETTASTRWNERANVLLTQRSASIPNLQGAASRILTYLSIAQYRAVLEAEKAKNKSTHPSVAAAVGGASVVVLSRFFPLDVAQLETYLDADLAAPTWPGARNEDPATGEATGRAVGVAVLTQAASDNYLAITPTQLGPGTWVQNGPVVPSLYGARPFFLTSPSQIRSVPPPAVGSPDFQAALTEILAMSSARTADQVAFAQSWGTGITVSRHNRTANALILEHHRTEREAARILAYANAATWDAQIGCWDSKLFYWYIRPPQADARITTVVGMPNHPSYPSGHSCVTASFVAVLMDAFPSEVDELEATILDAGLSRMIGGIHFRFDVEAGQLIGRRAAALALAGSLE